MLPMPDGYLPRRGDVFLLRAEVRFDVERSDDDGKVESAFVRVDTGEPHGYRDISVLLDAVVGIEKFAWKAGDMAVCPSPTFAGVNDEVTILAVDGTEAWVRPHSGGRSYTADVGRLSPIVADEPDPLGIMAEPVPVPPLQTAISDPEAVEAWQSGGPVVEAPPGTFTQVAPPPTGFDDRDEVKF